MGDQQQARDVGVVETRVMDLELPPGGLVLRNGATIPEVSVAYETYGQLSPKRDNAVFICHALTGDAHVAGRHAPEDPKPGWWNEMVGPGKGIDTQHYFVICANILGGCEGTTGPSSINPATDRPYGSAFPQIAISDMVDVQRLLLSALGVDRLAAVIGGSLGGMQALEWSIRYPADVDRCICIATGASLSTQALAFDVVARDAIVSDPHWAGGDYYGNPHGPSWGLSHARKIGHITYLSPEIMQSKFGRAVRSAQDDEEGDRERFQVESYLDYQGRKLVERFDANSYLRIAEAMDAYDLAKEHGSLEAAFAQAESKFLIIGLSSDWLFPPEQSVELSAALLRAGKHVTSCTLKAPYGHDAFLVDIQYLADSVRAFLPWVGEDRGSPDTSLSEEEGRRLSIIVSAVRPRSRVLDLGCGKGKLLSLLLREKDATCFGVDIDLGNIMGVIDRGHDVFQGDLDGGLAVVPDGAYDYAILSSTLQEVRRPQMVLREMLRVAREGIVTFPNFAHWAHRLTLGLLGRMPKSKILPYEWYETPSIHHTTVRDFIALCHAEGIVIREAVCMPGDRVLDRMLVRMRLCNLGAERVLVRISRADRDGAGLKLCRCFGKGGD